LDISSRIPARDKLIPVYAVIVLMVYSWTLLWFNYNLSAWLGFLNMGEIISIFTYAMVVNFLESLAVLAGIILLCALLPARLFLDAFVARGAALAILVLALMMFIAKQFSIPQYYPAELIRWSPAILAAILVVVFFLGKVAILRKTIEFVADRAIIFLYISIPVSIICILSVIVGNII
jgi:hypothetical protein